jgi:hypothetical protein
VASNEHGSVVTAKGDFYYWGGSWYVLGANIFVASGRPQARGNPVTAMGQSTVLTASGEEFANVGGTWLYRGNLGEIVGGRT